MHAMVLYDRSGAAVRTIGSWKDVTDERRQLEDLADQARRDPLTGLFNQGATLATRSAGVRSNRIFDSEWTRLLSSRLMSPMRVANNERTSQLPTGTPPLPV